MNSLFIFTLWVFLIAFKGLKKNMLVESFYRPLIFMKFIYTFWIIQALFSLYVFNYNITYLYIQKDSKLIVHILEGGSTHQDKQY